MPFPDSLGGQPVPGIRPDDPVRPGHGSPVLVLAAAVGLGFPQRPALLGEVPGAADQGRAKPAGQGIPDWHDRLRRLELRQVIRLSAGPQGLVDLIDQGPGLAELSRAAARRSSRSPSRPSSMTSWPRPPSPGGPARSGRPGWRRRTGRSRPGRSGQFPGATRWPRRSRSAPVPVRATHFPARFSVAFSGVDGRPSSRTWSRVSATRCTSNSKRAQKLAERLELAADRDAHLPSARVAVGEVEHDQGPFLGRRQARHRVQDRVGDLAGRQVQVGAVLLGDRAEHGLQRGFSPMTASRYGWMPPPPSRCAAGAKFSASRSSSSEPYPARICSSAAAGRMRMTGSALRWSVTWSNGI